MATHNPPHTATAALRDIGRDWRRWSKAERFAVKLTGLATVSVGLFLGWPHML